MELRLPKGSILIVDPNTTTEDGDLLDAHYPGTDEATLREICIEDLAHSGPQYPKAHNQSHLLQI